jgi:hypothetical protein
MFCSSTVFPEPDGPNMTERIGSLPQTSYFDCFTVNSFTCIGSTFGALFSLGSVLLFICLLKGQENSSVHPGVKVVNVNQLCAVNRCGV